MCPQARLNGIRFKLSHTPGNGVPNGSESRNGSFPPLINGPQQLGERFCESLDSFLFQLLRHLIHGYTSLGKSPELVLCFVQIASKSDFCLTMIFECL